MPKHEKSGITAIVLAAGESKRFPGQNKLLAKIDNETLLEKAAKTFDDSKCRRVIFVSGKDHSEFLKILKPFDIELIQNPSWTEGMGSSLAFGANSILSTNHQGILVCLADLPELKTHIIDKLIFEFLKSDKSQIVAPAHKGKFGHPIIFPPRLLESLTRQSGDTGAKHILKIEKDAIIRVPIDSEAIFRDIDTPEDLVR